MSTVEPARAPEAGRVRSGKAVFLDVDGTLIGEDGVLPDSARAAIRQARAHGHRVHLCTGRARSQLWPDLLDIGFDGLVAGAGAYVEAGGTVLAHHTFGTEDVRCIQDTLVARGVLVYFEAYDGVFAAPPVQERLLGVLDGLAGAATERLRRGPFRFVEHIDTRTDPSTRSITKAIYLDSSASVDEVRAELDGRFVVLPASTPLFGDDSGEVMLPGVNKATGIDVLVRHHGVAWEDTIGIGDGHNDLEMLARVGVGIAMGDAPDLVKDQADEVTSTLAEDGVWRAFERHGLVG